ncbi:MAG: hypothetical protein IKE24_12535 [Clostridia bacterium]|nr:hypothetical protein [Clostridia bacterium]
MKGMFVAVIHPRANGNGYECRVPDMPGCITSGKTFLPAWMVTQAEVYDNRWKDGVAILCKVLEDMRNEAAERERKEIAIRLIARSQLSFKEIASICDLSEEKVRELAQQRTT